MANDPHEKRWISQNFRVSQSRCLSGYVRRGVSIFCKVKKASNYRILCLFSDIMSERLRIWTCRSRIKALWILGLAIEEVKCLIVSGSKRKTLVLPSHSLAFTIHHKGGKAWGQDGWILAKFFFCVFMDRDGVEVHKLVKKEQGQYPAILTEQTWSIKDLLYGFWGHFACGIQPVVREGKMAPSCPLG